MTTKKKVIVEVAFGDTRIYPATVEKANELFEQCADYVYPRIREIADKLGKTKFISKKVVSKAINAAIRVENTRAEVIACLMDNQYPFKIEYKAEKYQGPELAHLEVHWKKDAEEFEALAFRVLSVFQEKRDSGVTEVVDETEYDQAKMFKILSDKSVSSFKAEIGYVRHALEFINSFSHRDVKYELVESEE